MSRVFILGAGSTAGYVTHNGRLQPPVAKNFLSKAAQLCTNPNLANDVRLRREEFDRGWEFVDQHYHATLDQLSDEQNHPVDIEELLTFVDLSKDQALRKQLIRLMVLTLHRILWGQPCPHHSRLLGSLRRDDAVLTFNWDLILDNITAQDNGVDYGTDLLHVIGQPRVAEQRPLILKLHGSLNWLSCTMCGYQEARLGEGNTAAYGHDGAPVNCPDCHRAMDPIMIFPTLFKKYNKLLFHQIWERARCVLRSARDVTVVGYSLPATDFAAKWLFLQTSAERRHPLQSLTIVDLAPEPLQRRFADAFYHNLGEVRGVRGGIETIAAEEQL